MDRAGRSPFDLMDELEQVLGIRACPINWPIGTDGDFKGVYHRQEAAIEVYSGGTTASAWSRPPAARWMIPPCAS